MIIDSIVY